MKRGKEMHSSPENLYIMFGRVPDQKEPPYQYTELVRGTSHYTPTEIEKAFYSHARIEMDGYTFSTGDVLVWFEDGQPVVMMAGETAFFPQKPTHMQYHALTVAYIEYILGEKP